MQLTITKIEKSTWYAGMLQDCFSGEGWTGRCNSSLYRSRMQSTGLVAYGIGRRGFALGTMPLNWTPKVGDVIEIHPTQL